MVAIHCPICRSSPEIYGLGIVLKHYIGALGQLTVVCPQPPDNIPAHGVYGVPHRLKESAAIPSAAARVITVSGMIMFPW